MESLLDERVRVHTMPSYWSTGPKGVLIVIPVSSLVARTNLKQIITDLSHTPGHKEAAPANLQPTLVAFREILDKLRAHIVGKNTVAPAGATTDVCDPIELEQILNNTARGSDGMPGGEPDFYARNVVLQVPLRSDTLDEARNIPMAAAYDGQFFCYKATPATERAYSNMVQSDMSCMSQYHMEPAWRTFIKTPEFLDSSASYVAVRVVEGAAEFVETLAAFKQLCDRRGLRCDIRVPNFEHWFGHMATLLCRVIDPKQLVLTPDCFQLWPRKGSVFELNLSSYSHNRTTFPQDLLGSTGLVIDKDVKRWLGPYLPPSTAGHSVLPPLGKVVAASADWVTLDLRQQTVNEPLAVQAIRFLAEKMLYHPLSVRTLEVQSDHCSLLGWQKLLDQQARPTVLQQHQQRQRQHQQRQRQTAAVAAATAEQAAATAAAAEQQKLGPEVQAHGLHAAAQLPEEQREIQQLGLEQSAVDQHQQQQQQPPPSPSDDEMADVPLEDAATPQQQQQQQEARGRSNTDPEERKPRETPAKQRARTAAGAAVEGRELDFGASQQSDQEPEQQQSDQQQQQELNMIGSAAGGGGGAAAVTAAGSSSAGAALAGAAGDTATALGSAAAASYAAAAAVGGPAVLPPPPAVASPSGYVLAVKRMSEQQPDAVQQLRQWLKEEQVVPCILRNDEVAVPNWRSTTLDSVAKDSIGWLVFPPGGGDQVVAEAAGKQGSKMAKALGSFQANTVSAEPVTQPDFALRWGQLSTPRLIKVVVRHELAEGRQREVTGGASPRTTAGWPPASPDARRKALELKMLAFVVWGLRVLQQEKQLPEQLRALQPVISEAGAVTSALVGKVWGLGK